MSAPFTRTEIAPVLLVFGDHAGRIGDLVRLRPGLLRQLAFAPPPAIHALGAFLHLAAASNLPDVELAANLEDADPRDLMRAAIPMAPARLYRALGRLGDRVRDRQFYERLGAVAAGPIADVLWGEHEIDETVLTFAERLLTLDPAVLRFRHLLNCSTVNAEQLHTALMFAKCHGVLTDDDLMLPAQAGLPALGKRLRSATDQIRAPSPGFVLEPPLRVIRSLGELRELGKKLNNCLSWFSSYGADYAPQFASGATVFIASDEPPFVATLNRVAPGLHELAAVSGLSNQTIPPSTTDDLCRRLREAGVVMPPRHVSWSLNWMATSRRHGRGAVARDPFDEDDLNQ